MSTVYRVLAFVNLILLSIFLIQFEGGTLISYIIIGSLIIFNLLIFIIPPNMKYTKDKKKRPISKVFFCLVIINVIVDLIFNILMKSNKLAIHTDKRSFFIKYKKGI